MGQLFKFSEDFFSNAGNVATVISSLIGLATLAVALHVMRDWQRQVVLSSFIEALDRVEDTINHLDKVFFAKIGDIEDMTEEYRRTSTVKDIYQTKSEIFEAQIGDIYFDLGLSIGKLNRLNNNVVDANLDATEIVLTLHRFLNNLTSFYIDLIEKDKAEKDKAEKGNPAFEIKNEANKYFIELREKLHKVRTEKVLGKVAV